MSTKIYYAAKWQGDQLELMEYLKDARRKYEEYNIDLFFPILTDTTSFSELQNFIEDSVKIGINVRANIDASICVYFHETGIYLQYFGCEGWLINDLNYGHEKAVDFAYENQTDCQLEYLTEEEWEYRGKIWDEIMPECRPPIYYGLVYELYYDGYLSTLIYDLYKRFWRNRREILFRDYRKTC